MFQFIVNRVQRSADTLISKYVTRIAVAVPFLVAMGFGTAAASVALTEIYGELAAHTILAAVFSLVGLAAAAAIATSDNPALATAAAEPEEQLGVDDIDASSPQPGKLDPEMLVTAISTIGPAALPALIRLLARNTPLIVGAVILAYLLFSDARKSATAVPASAND